MQYFVIGPNGQKHGPVDVTTLKEWVNECRIIVGTRLESESTGAQFPAEMLPELGLSANTFQPPSPHAHPIGPNSPAALQLAKPQPFQNRWSNAGGAIGFGGFALGLSFFKAGIKSIPFGIIAIVMGCKAIVTDKNPVGVLGIILGSAAIFIYIGLIVGLVNGTRI